MLGEIIADRYLIEKRLGQGGFGTVYLCTDLKLKRQVALKSLDLADGEAAGRKRFAQEAECLAGLDHPRIVAVYDSGEWQDRPFLVMQYVQGPTLQDVAARGPVALADVLGWAAGICEGLAYAHRRGVVHRDLTLRNVMLDQGGTRDNLIKILDFGLAKLAGGTGASTGRTFVGTPSYMSPEQIQGGAIDRRTDIFSFGVCLFRLACGRFPFVGEHPMAVIYQILHQTELSFAEGVPPGLVHLICACLEKAAARRPPDFEAVEALLAPLASQLPAAAARAEGAFEAAPAWQARSSKRNPYLNRVMIKDPRDFFGRDKEVQKIYARLDAPHPQSISVVGERRIGKSSLLNYVYQRGNRRRHMSQYDETLFMYLDFQQDTEFTVTKFVDFVFTALEFEMQGGYSCAGRARDLAQMKAVFQDFMNLGKRIVILMDEFEVITNNPNFDSDFFSFLRAMANSYKVAYVTSSCQELQALCHNQDISDSPFFNIFSNLPLRPFSREEAMALITGPSRREGLDLAPYADAIMDLAGFHPMMLQIACASVFEGLLSDERAQLDWAKAEGAFREEAGPHFQAAWEHLDATAQKCLSRLARGKPISKQQQFAREQLIRRGLVLTDAGGDRFGSRAFRDFVLEAASVSGGGGGGLGARLAEMFGRRGK